MGSRSYNYYNPNAQPNSSMSEGPPPGYPPHGPSQGGPPYYPAFPAPNHGGPMPPPVPPRAQNLGLLPMIQYVNKFLL
jgi:hypothetical protein